MKTTVQSRKLKLTISVVVPLLVAIGAGTFVVAMGGIEIMTLSQSFLVYALVWGLPFAAGFATTNAIDKRQNLPIWLYIPSSICMTGLMFIVVWSLMYGTCIVMFEASGMAY